MNVMPALARRSPLQCVAHQLDDQIREEDQHRQHKNLIKLGEMSQLFDFAGYERRLGRYKKNNAADRHHSVDEIVAEHLYDG